MATLLLGTVLASGCAAARQPADLPRSVEELTKYHRAAREAIQSISCEFEYVSENTRPVLTVIRRRGAYWSRGDCVRTQYVDLNGLDTDYFSHEGRVFTFSRGEKTLSGAIGDRSCQPTYCPRFSLLLEFPLPNGRHVRLEHFLSEAERVTGYWVDENAGECTVDLQFPEQPPSQKNLKFELTFAAKHGYLARKWVCTTTSPLGVANAIKEITDFVVVAPGVSFPKKSVGISTFSGDQHQARVTMTLSNLKVNQEIAPKRFQFSFPEGIQIADNITRTTYQVNAKGERISEAKPFNLVVAPPPIAAAVPGAITQTEGWEWGTWGMLISGFVLVTALVARGLSRWAKPAG